MKPVLIHLKGGRKTDRFEELLRENIVPLERFVKYRVGNAADADDIIQETCVAALSGFSALSDESSFKAWLIGIARNKCNDYFRRKAKLLEIPLDSIKERITVHSAHGVTTAETVRETLDALGEKDKQILYLYYFKELPQADIAKRLGIPLGTVKSRIHTAKNRFKEKYPYRPKGDKTMKKMPELMPEYRIKVSGGEPFEVNCEELMGWFIVPRLGEKLTWAAYDMPERTKTEECEQEVVGRAEIHGIEGVEITSVEHAPLINNMIGEDDPVKRRFVAQLTDTHCRYLAETHSENGVRKYYTFLDGDLFMENWGFGENNRGKETRISKTGNIERKGNVITTKRDPVIDVAGRYTVEICGKKYDTICVIDASTYQLEIVTENYIDKNGRTVLWRRFNKDSWCYERYGRLWSEALPDNEKLFVNGETYVHWYDCITSYIL